MNEKTLQALRGAIAKWEGILAGTEVDRAALNCPLCKKFSKDWCSKCPVRQRTGLHGCSGTPYIRWWKLQIGSGKPFSIRTGVQRKAAQDELDFLKSLLP